MTDSAERFVRIYKKGEDGNLFDTRAGFSESDVWRSVPRVGEIIVSPFLRHSKGEPRDYTNRTVYVVEQVYYRPDKRGRSDDDDSWICLLVSERPMRESEWALL